ncbi:MAG: hypothetical protein PHV34_08980 [Verrucomicrobiae bacterium]|nr:hypothetical protein [Verrucomicrobiae bacterium]
MSVTPSGHVHCLYTELIDLAQLGKLQIERASTIEFDGKRQHWVVLNRKGQVIFTDWSRQNCLSWEENHADPLRKKFK